MKKKARAEDAEGESNLIGFRNADLAARLRAIAKANANRRGLITAIVTTAVERELDRLERGEPLEIPITLNVPNQGAAKGTTSAKPEDSLRKLRASTRAKRTA
jgi:hypothetical protein